MTRLQAAVISVVVVPFLIVALAVTFAGKMLLDGLGHNRAKLNFHYAGMALRRGDMTKGANGIVHGVQIAFEAGMRWQVASYYLDRTTWLKSDGRLAEAVDACLAASRALGRYDSNWEVRRECTDLFWEERGY
jgi:hypothetical protein